MNILFRDDLAVLILIDKDNLFCDKWVFRFVIFVAWINLADPFSFNFNIVEIFFDYRIEVVALFLYIVLKIHIL